MKRLAHSYNNLNQKLTDFENQIYNLLKKQNQLALKKLLDNEDNIIDYSLSILITILYKNITIDKYTIDVKPYFLNDTITDDLFKLKRIKENMTDIKYDVNICYIYKQTL